MEGTWLDFHYIFKGVNENGREWIVESLLFGAECPVNIAAHGVDVPSDSQEGGVMIATRHLQSMVIYLSDEGAKVIQFGRLYFSLAGARLPVFIRSDEVNLIHLHLKITALYNLRKCITIQLN